jgi:hypothetical protein
MTFENRVREFSDIERFQTNLKKLGLMAKEVKSYFDDFGDSCIDKERHQNQIYQILGEKGNPITFENRVRKFSDIGRFQANSKNLRLTIKEVKSYLLDSEDPWINDERG